VIDAASRPTIVHRASGVSVAFFSSLVAIVADPGQWRSSFIVRH
jgi:hypothetical protein